MKLWINNILLFSFTMSEPGKAPRPDDRVIC